MALQVDLLEQSFGDVAAAFYQRLFALSPAMQPFFAGTDMDEQEAKLLAALALVMEHLRQPEMLASVLKHLGERHLAVGVTPDCFELGSEALLETLGLFLGDQWTPELQDAWAQGYGASVTLMLDETPAESSTPQPTGT